MPTDKPKILLILNDDLIQRIGDFRFENRINSQSEAMRRLIEDSLERYEKTKNKTKKK